MKTTALLLKTVSSWHSSDNVRLACHGVESFKIYNITVKKYQNQFYSAKSGL